jgi:hypothetical protein
MAGRSTTTKPASYRLQRFAITRGTNASGNAMRAFGVVIPVLEPALDGR